MENRAFKDLNLSTLILNAIDDLGFTEATEVQYKTIPFILEGRDVLGRSSTGTGKTAAFALPSIELIDEDVRRPYVLIMCPTRELAMQVSDETKKFAKYKKNVRVATIYGGQSMELQIRDLRTANIVVGTPGRIMDHIRRKTLKLADLKMVILDEADEMLNMGFYEDIQTILKEVPEDRQTILFSATMPPAIMKITKEFLKNPEIVAVDKGRRTINTIEQCFYQVRQAQKMQAVNIILQQFSSKRSLVFCNTKRMVDELVEYLNDNGFKSVGLHGDMRQNVRTQVMNSFKSGRLHVLVATDVAARGIDVEDIDAVVNFDIPQEMEYYIHRIGRTGRAGKTGLSITLVCNKLQLKKLYEIKHHVDTDITEKTLPTSDDILLLKSDKIVSKVKIALDENYAKWENVVDTLVADGHSEKSIAAACIAMIASKDRKVIPQLDEVSFSTSVKKTKATAANFERNSDNIGDKVTISVDMGRSQRMAPNFLVGAIVEGTGLPASAIGKIDIFEHVSTVAVSADDAKTIVDNMATYKVKNILCHFVIDENPPKQTKSYNREKPYSFDGNNKSHGSSGSRNGFRKSSANGSSGSNGSYKAKKPFFKAKKDI